MYHRVAIFFFCLFFLSFFSLSPFNMDFLRIGSLNINGGRDIYKRALVSEVIEQKNLNVIFLQETHSDVNNEIEWGKWWRGQYRLSHKSNLSAGVAVLFSPCIRVNILNTEEPINGRLLVVKADIEGNIFYLVNVYAPNIGYERLRFFSVLSTVLKQCFNDGGVIIGGDWNCTENSLVDRNTEEPHIQSSSCLLKIIRAADLLDIWRVKHPDVRQYTWVKVNSGRVSAARLDRIYVSTFLSSQITECSIIPMSFTDHKLVLTVIRLSQNSHKSSFWHFNVKLLQDNEFCKCFELFWQEWRKNKSSFENLRQWWDIGKVNIKMFCLQYTANSTKKLKETIKSVENEISSLERELINRYDSTLKNTLQEKKMELGSFLNERVKGALIRSRFVSIVDMDAPSAFFFNLERKAAKQKQMTCLQLPNGKMTHDVREMRRHAVDFYSNLYTVEHCDRNCSAQLLQDLPQIDSNSRTALDSALSYQEFSDALSQLSSGKCPGFDGLQSEFYKRFWHCIGQDLYEVLCVCNKDESLPVFCQRAVLSLLPKKGDLSILKNWRPVALMTTEYKILSKCLANRLKKYLHLIIHKDQTYCVPERTISDNLFLIRDVFDICKAFGIRTGFISLDQEKAFDRIDHRYLFDVLEAFGLGKGFLKWVRILYTGAACMVKIGGGLSRPISVTRGIRQGCPLSGQLYSIVIEPLLCKLREKLSGFSIPGFLKNPGTVLSAYADDITVFVNNVQDVNDLSDALNVYEKASSAKVNWDKSEALWVGQAFLGGSSKAAWKS